MLIKRVYEIAPLSCPHCGSQMKVVTFIPSASGEDDRENSAEQRPVQASAPRAPLDADDLVLELDDQAAESQELTYVYIDTFLK